MTTETDTGPNTSHDLNALWHVILEDLLQALNVLEVDDSQYNRRVAIRTILATAEGATFCVKQRLVLRMPGRPRLTRAQMVLLQEESFTLDSRGEIQVQRKFIPIDVHFRFVMNLFCRAYFPDFKLDVNNPGWTAFKRTIDVRNRITHPRNASLMCVTDTEMRDARLASDWIIRTITLKTADALEKSMQVIEGLEKRIRDTAALAGVRATP